MCILFRILKGKEREGRERERGKREERERRERGERAWRKMTKRRYFYFAAIAVFNGWLMVGYATFYTNFPVFSLVLDEDVSEQIAFRFPEYFPSSLLLSFSPLGPLRSLSLSSFSPRSSTAKQFKAGPSYCNKEEHAVSPSSSSYLSLPLLLISPSLFCLPPSLPFQMLTLLSLSPGSTTNCNREGRCRTKPFSSGC